MGKLENILDKVFITEIRPGSDSYKDFRGRILYAVARDFNNRMQCSATLGFILERYLTRQELVVNYKEAFIEYLNFNDEMVKNVN